MRIEQFAICALGPGAGKLDLVNSNFKTKRTYENNEQQRANVTQQMKRE